MLMANKVGDNKGRHVQGITDETDHLKNIVRSKVFQLASLYSLKEIDIVKSWLGQVENIIYCTRQLRRIRFNCVAEETMDLWAFL